MSWATTLSSGLPGFTDGRAICGTVQECFVSLLEIALSAWVVFAVIGTIVHFYINNRDRRPT